MDNTLLTIAVTTAVSASITLIVKVIWDWIINKNGKHEIEHINDNINEKWKEFSELKNLILTSYVKRDEFEKHLARFELVRDMAMKNEQNIKMVHETVRQNVQRMSQLENS